MASTAPADRRAALAGRGIVVTRPREQAPALVALIEAAGGTAHLFPAIEIEDLPDLQQFFALVDRLEEFDLAVFISPSAVRKALNLVRLRRARAPWPAHLRVAAPGRGSRRELENAGFAQVIAPQVQADSEALLALPELAAGACRRVVIFRGEGGRELLAETLVARGAQVEVAECYRRTRPRAEAGPLLAAWARGAVHAVSVSSIEGFANFYEMIGALGRQWLRTTPVFAPHARIAEEVRRRGAGECVATGPGDAELVDALVAYFRAAK